MRSSRRPQAGRCSPQPATRMSHKAMGASSPMWGGGGALAPTVHGAEGTNTMFPPVTLELWWGGAVWFLGKGGGGSECLFFCLAKGTYGNVTEELFVLTLLLCDPVPLWSGLGIGHLRPTAGGPPLGDRCSRGLGVAIAHSEGTVPEGGGAHRPSNGAFLRSSSYPRSHAPCAPARGGGGVGSMCNVGAWQRRPRAGDRPGRPSPLCPRSHAVAAQEAGQCKYEGIFVRYKFMMDDESEPWVTTKVCAAQSARGPSTRSRPHAACRSLHSGPALQLDPS